MNKQKVDKIIKEALANGKKTLLEPEAKTLISEWGIPVPKSIQIPPHPPLLKGGIGGFPSSRIKKFTPPYALKVVSEDILHKSDAGGVAAGLENIKDINKALTKMIAVIKGKAPKAKIDGFLLEEMAPKGVEAIIGALRDPQFGPTVMFGIGGIAVELMKDVSYRLAPLNKKEAIEMIKEVKGYPLLTGFRGSKPVDIDSLSDTIIKLSEILIKIEDIKEIEINPLIVYEKGVIAVDVKVILNHFLTS